MKIQCNVTAVEDCGDKVKIKLQGVEVGAADWRRASVVELLVDNVHDIGKRMYVGRAVDIEVKPR